MPIFFYKFSKNIVTTLKLQVFWISGIFPTCFSCFLSANTADKKHVDLQKFYQAILLQYSKSQANVLVIKTKKRPQTFENETRKMGSIETKTKSQDSITAKHAVGKPIFSIVNAIYISVWTSDGISRLWILQTNSL